MRASISTWRTGTSSLVIMSWICSRREGMSEMNSWLVRGSAMTLPRELSRLPELAPLPPPPPPPEDEVSCCLMSSALV